MRAALGAGSGALRRTLFAESLVLCGTGAVVGLLLARPFVLVVARYAAHFSVRALDVSVDASVLWVSAGLALAAAVLLAFVPRLPARHAPAGLGLVTGLRITPGTNRRLRMFATTQMALSFILLAGAAMLLTTLVSIESGNTGYDTQHVAVFDLPPPALGEGIGDEHVLSFYDELVRRTEQLPGVVAVATGTNVPWRDGTEIFNIPWQFSVEGYTSAVGEEAPLARFRAVSPRFFATVGVPLLAGREFTDADRGDGNPFSNASKPSALTGDGLVAIVSQNVAQRFFPNGDAISRHVEWLNLPGKRRIVGVVANVDDVNVVRQPAMAIYVPVRQLGMAGRLFVRATSDPHALIPIVTRIARQLSPDQPVEQPATLEDVRSEMLSSDRLNAFVFSGFASIALLIAVVGVAGVLAFSVSARTREFGVRLAIGLAPRQLLTLVLSDGLGIAMVGVSAGTIGGLALARLSARLFGPVQLPSTPAAVAAAALLVAAAIVASLMPAARASRLDVLQALRLD